MFLKPIQFFYLHPYIKYAENNFILYNGISIIYTNIYIYIYIFYMLFTVLFLFDTTKLKALTDLKVCVKYNYVLYTLIAIILSIGGVPPFLGFSGKFAIFCLIVLTQKQLYLYLFSILNFFSIYFYIQNLRFLAGKTITAFFLKHGYYYFLNKGLINTTVFGNFFNFFGIIFIDDVYYNLNNLYLFKNFF